MENGDNGSKRRVFTAGFGTESNTFVGRTLTVEDFRDTFYFGPGRHPHRLTEVSAPLYVLRELASSRGWDVVEGTYAFALPGGRLERRSYELIRDEILDQLRACLPVDFVVLSLHGAMCADGYDDCEGDLLHRIREIVGMQVPVGAEMDLHAHLSPAMVDAADVLVAFKEYPHTDFLDRARELIDLLNRRVTSGRAFAKAVFDCRTLARFHTTQDPMRAILQWVRELEISRGVASISIIHGFPFGDVADAGTKVLVLADGLDTAINIAALVGERLISIRDQAVQEAYEIDDAIDRALAAPPGPVVIADVDDNPGSGAMGNDLSLLSQLLQRGGVRACLGPVWDPELVRRAHEAGVGGHCLIWISGVAVEDAFARSMTAEVVGLSAEACQTWAGTQMSLGAACALRVGTVTAVVTTKRDQAYGPDLFSSVGVAPLDCRLVVVKSAQHFMAGFEPHVTAVVRARGGGPLTSDFSQLRYRHVRRPLWPLDPDTPRRRLIDWVRHWAKERPDDEAAADGSLRLTWRDLDAQVRGWCAALIASGVRPGDRVATLTVPSTAFLIQFLGAAAAGAIWVGLNPRYTEAELDRVISQVDPRMVVSEVEIDGRSYHRWLDSVAARRRVVVFDGPTSTGFDTVSGLVAAGDSIGNTAVDDRIALTRAGDPFLIVFTSGSSGSPKGVVITQAALTGASEIQVREWNVAPLRVLNNLPINHIGCVGDLSCYSVIGGGTLLFSSRFDANAVPALIQKERVTVLGQVPSMFQMIVDSPGFSAAALSSLRLLFWGGAHAGPDLVARLQLLSPWLATSYGQSETVGSITFTQKGTSVDELSDSVGRAAPPYQIRICPLDGKDAMDVGEVEVRTPFGFQGYWNDPQATASTLKSDGWQRTGDLGTILPNGSLRLVGRVHNVFKSGGYNVNPPEIEAALLTMPGIVEACVLGMPDPLWGSVPVAFLVVSRSGPDARAISAYLRTMLANYKIPKRFEFLDFLPRLPVGKIDTRSLLARLSASQA